MQLPIKIYFNNCEIFIGENQQFPSASTLNLEALQNIVQKQVHTSFTKFEFKASSYQEAYAILEKTFVIIEAGGGVVTNPDQEILFIHRKGKWDLPKGKKEPYEDIKSCAIREVEEECGLKNVIAEQLLQVSWHIYKENGTLMLKASYWYKMHILQHQVAIPQMEEDITQAVWVKLREVPALLENSYLNIRDVMNSFMHHNQA